MTKQLLTEFLGTFFLTFVVALTGDPLAIGAVLVALVYMGGYISGAHYNPAVTLAMWLTNKISQKTASAYALTQVLAATFAIGIYTLLSGSMFSPQLGQGVPLLTGLSIEVLFTFLLVTVILHVAATNKTKDNQYYGLAIGLTLLAGVLAGGPLSGAVYNPAIGIAPMIVNLQHYVPEVILYIFGPFLGAALAGLFYKSTTKL